MSASTLDSLLTTASELASREKALVQEIRLLTSRQSGLTALHKLEELLSTVAEKGNCIKTIDEIDEELAKLKGKIIEASGISLHEMKGAHKEKWETIEKTRQEIRSIIKETLVFDDNNRKKIDQTFDELKNNILSLRIKRGCCRSYQTPAAQSGGYFVDQKK